MLNTKHRAARLAHHLRHAHGLDIFRDVDIPQISGPKSRLAALERTHRACHSDSARPPAISHSHAGTVSVLVGVCPQCGVRIDEQGWPLAHQTDEGELCPYDWTQDPLQQTERQDVR